MSFIYIWYKSEEKNQPPLFFSPLLTPVTYISQSSYLDQDILAEAREGIFEAIKADVVPLS